MEVTIDHRKSKLQIATGRKPRIEWLYENIFTSNIHVSLKMEGKGTTHFYFLTLPRCTPPVIFRDPH